MPHRRPIVARLALLFLSLAACAPVPESSADVPRITPDEVAALQNAGKAVVIADTRLARHYERERIPGAISVPARETEDHLDELPRQATIVFY